MQNEDMLRRICTGPSAAELRWFVKHFDEIDDDSEDMFERYYSLRWILKVIEKYQSKLVDAEYLGNWMASYEIILSMRVNFETKENQDYLKEIVKSEILDWLISLSHFDENDCYFDLDKFKRIFTSLDLILHEHAQYKAIFSKYEQGEDDAVLILNESAKCFARINNPSLSSNPRNLKEVELSELNEIVQQLKSCGFTDLKFRIWDEEEIKNLENASKIISFEEAYAIAKEEKPNIDHCYEFERGFSFGNSKDPLSIGSPEYEPVVVLRKDGKTVNTTCFLMYMGAGKFIREISLSTSND